MKLCTGNLKSSMEFFFTLVGAMTVALVLVAAFVTLCAAIIVWGKMIYLTYGSTMVVATFVIWILLMCIVSNTNWTYFDKCEDE